MAYFRDLKTLRVSAGISKAELSRKSGISRDLIDKAEAGGDCMIEKLHTLLNTLDSLYYSKNGKPLNPENHIS